MTVHTKCCPGTYRTSESETVSSEHGVTIGDLYDRTMKISNEHRFCPNASYRLLDEDGFVNVSVTFKANITLNAKDPVMAKHMARLAEKRADSSRRDVVRAKQRAYAAAKRSGPYNPQLFEWDLLANILSPFQRQPNPNNARLHRRKP